mgnify:CR=1 FL=1
MTINKETKGGASPTPKYFVHIVESPSAKDLLNARTEGHLLTEALSLAGIISSYNLATDYSTFLEALGPRLYEVMQETKGTPILHLSTHGNEEGIELTDHTFIKWHVLRELLLPINKVLNGGLVVCMSSCSGYSGCRMAMSVEREIPFFGNVIINIGFASGNRKVMSNLSPKEVIKWMKNSTSHKPKPSSEIGGVWLMEREKKNKEAVFMEGTKYQVQIMRG